jgi:hypothetical protein
VSYCITTRDKQQEQLEHDSSFILGAVVLVVLVIMLLAGSECFYFL